MIEGTLKKPKQSGIVPDFHVVLLTVVCLSTNCDLIYIDAHETSDLKGHHLELRYFRVALLVNNVDNLIT